MGTPFKMKGNPMQRNFAIESPLTQKITNKKTNQTLPPSLPPTASDTLGAYAYQQYPSLRSNPKGGPKIKTAHDKLEGHIVSEAEMRKSSKSYMKKKKKSR